MDTKLMTNLEPYPDQAPIDPPSPLEQAQERAQRRWGRTRAVQMSCTIIYVICGLFAVVLAAQIIMVMGNANPGNGVASFVRDFSAAVSLGFNNLFTPADAKIQVLLNDGLAALVWLALGAVVTNLIRRFALPGPHGVMR